MKSIKDMRHTRAMVLYLIPVLAYALLIFYLSVLPVGYSPPGDEPLPEPGTEGAEPADSPAYSQPAKTILWLKYNIPFFDELANIGLYLIFGILMYRMWLYLLPLYTSLTSDKINTDHVMKLKITVLVIIISFIYSSFMEYSQMALASRIMDTRDMVYNTLGSGAGACVFLLWHFRRIKKVGRS